MLNRIHTAQVCVARDADQRTKAGVIENLPGFHPKVFS